MILRPRVKICGMTDPEAAAQAARVGADAIGIVFYPASSRNVACLHKARDIAQAAGPFVQVVGLFVTPAAAWVEEVMEQVPLNLLQFHGEEDEPFCAQFKRPYIKALRMKPGVDVEQQALRFHSARGLLLDAYKPGTPGGTGETFDWQRVPEKLAETIVLAGGLSPSNVAEAVVQVRPWGVDVSGGVESAAGVKSPEMVKQFIRNAKSALCRSQ